MRHSLVLSAKVRRILSQNNRLIRQTLDIHDAFLASRIYNLINIRDKCSPHDVYLHARETFASTYTSPYLEHNFLSDPLWAVVR